MHLYTPKGNGDCGDIQIRTKRVITAKEYVFTNGSTNITGSARFL